jgi:transposase
MKIHAVTDDKGRPVVLEMTTGKVSDYVPAKAFLGKAPKAKHIVADKVYDSDDLRKFIRKRGAKPVILPRQTRKKQRRHARKIYERRNRVERFF